MGNTRSRLATNLTVTSRHDFIKPDAFVLEESSQ